MSKLFKKKLFNKIPNEDFFNDYPTIFYTIKCQFLIKKLLYLIQY